MQQVFSTHWCMSEKHASLRSSACDYRSCDQRPVNSDCFSFGFRKQTKSCFLLCVFCQLVRRGLKTKAVFCMQIHERLVWECWRWTTCSIIVSNLEQRFRSAFHGWSHYWPDLCERQTLKSKLFSSPEAFFAEADAPCSLLFRFPGEKLWKMSSGERDASCGELISKRSRPTSSIDTCQTTEVRREEDRLSLRL